MNMLSKLSTMRETAREAHRERQRSGINMNVRISAFLFSGKRADYYQYLADMIEGTKGRMSLRDIFASDADRYGKSPRGVLSDHWASQFEEGGSLGKTFEGTLPKQDVAMIEVLQQAGGEGALEEGLRDLASNTALVAKARTMVLTTMAASLVCLSVVFALIFAMPAFTVPKLADAFSMLPVDYHPQRARDLFAFADFIINHWLKLTLLIITVTGGLIWSLGNITGTSRSILDRFGLIWGLYRDFQSVRFICSLAAMVQRRGNTSRGLRSAIAMQLPGASRWKAAHLNQMIDMIDHGIVGPSLFKTGILDKVTAWYLEDLIKSRGLEDALHFVRSRIETRIIQKISIQSAIFSWTLMLVSISIAGYLLFWHILAIDDMRLALQEFLA